MLNYEILEMTRKRPSTDDSALVVFAAGGSIGAAIYPIESSLRQAIACFCKAGLPEPQFRQEGGQFIHTLPRPTPQVAPEVELVTADKADLWANVLRTLLETTGQPTGQVTGQVASEALTFFQDPRTGKEIQDAIGLRHREMFLDNYLNPLIQSGVLERTIPDKPTSPLQKYQLTEKGRARLANQIGTAGKGAAK